ncbi:hypothetical protein [Serratia sp. (in: enterobacteria)]|uniref:hypothetical protein n=1 Tax=Serratia sp. (in: enterobacteria) TaxID=616 RepID=UPI003988DF11
MATQQAVFTVKDLVELHLTERIEDRHGKDGKIILGARNSTSQYATRRTLTKDVVEKVDDRAAQDVTRKDVIELVMAAV